MDKTWNGNGSWNGIKGMIDSKPGGRRKERPRLRRLEDVEKNLREINVNRWRR
jgi:hypothetical protein